MKVAFLFPGQGTQRVAMGRDICTHWLTARWVFEEASDTLGYDLQKRCFEGPLATLTTTEEAQPAILTTSVAVLRVLEEVGVCAEVVAGHSVGEFAALVAAESLSFADALRLVRQRGLLIADIRQPGMMCAALTSTEAIMKRVVAVALEAGVDVAAYNSLTQVVFSGSLETMQCFTEKLRDRKGVRVQRLNVSHAFHSRLMQGMRGKWATFLNGFAVGEAKLPVGMNVSGEFATSPEEIQEDLREQCTHPVRWQWIFDGLLRQGVDVFIEVGVSRVLAALARNWEENPQVLASDSSTSLAWLIKRMQKP